MHVAHHIYVSHRHFLAMFSFPISIFISYIANLGIHNQFVNEYENRFISEAGDVTLSTTNGTTSANGAGGGDAMEVS